MKEYLKMADIFGDISVKVRGSNGRHVMCEDILTANCFCTDSANHIAHAINSHDELVAEVERLRRQLAYAFMAGWEEGVNGMECDEAEVASVEIAEQF